MSDHVHCTCVNVRRTAHRIRLAKAALVFLLPGAVALMSLIIIGLAGISPELAPLVPKMGVVLLIGASALFYASDYLWYASSQTAVSDIPSKPVEAENKTTTTPEE